MGKEVCAKDVDTTPKELVQAKPDTCHANFTKWSISNKTAKEEN
jgi:hypothetical protein